MATDGAGPDGSGLFVGLGLVPERMGRRALVHGGTLGQTRGQGEVLPWFGLSAWMDAGMA